MNWLRLTGYEGCTVLVNMDNVAFAYPMQNSSYGYQTELRTSHEGEDGGICVQETIEQIASMLPFSAQPVPGNYRANPDG